MDPHPPDDQQDFSRPGIEASAFGASNPAVEGIVGSALAGTQPVPEATGWRAKRAKAAAASASKVYVPQRQRSRSRGGMSTTVGMLAWGLTAVVVFGIALVATGVVQLGPPGTGPTDVIGGTQRDGAWSYYHDTDYDTSRGAAKWSTDRSRSSDPDEAVLGNTSRWEYDGPYRYGPYGSDGMRRRSQGTDATDPLYSQPDPVQDVFRQYGGDLDPSGGQPVGAAPSSMTTPYYAPDAGYSNPDANRIRMAYGEGVGRGASYAP